MTLSWDRERAPLDTGYSWVILVVSFLLNVCYNACAGALGVMMVELTETFDTKKSVILAIGGLQVSVGFLLSVTNGWLIKRFGCRLVGGVASVAASLSMIASSCAKSVTSLYITYGCFLGFSSAFLFTISSIAVQQYFDKHRTLAHGTIMAGLSAGLFMWPPLTRFFIDRYSWRGALLLLGGIQLNGIVLTALIRPRRPDVTVIVSRPTEVKAGDSLPLSVDSGHTLSPAVESHPLNDGSGQIVTPMGESHHLDVKSGEAASFEGESLPLNLASDQTLKTDEGASLILKTDQTVATEGESRSLGVDSRHIGLCSKPSNLKRNPASRCFRALFKVIIVFPYYLLFLLAILMVQMGNVMPYTLTPSRAAALGISKDRGALLVSIASAVSGICRVLSGFLGDSPRMNRFVLCAVASLIGGALTAMSAAFDTFLSLAIIFAFIGIPSAAYMASFGAIVVDIVGTRYIQQGVGLSSFAFGLAQLTTFLVTGSIQDLTGDPKYSFMLFGVIEAAGGVVFFIVYLLHRKRLAAQENTKVPVETHDNGRLSLPDRLKSTSSLQIC